jgi:hypothetical protein
MVQDSCTSSVRLPEKVRPPVFGDPARSQGARGWNERILSFLLEKVKTLPGDKNPGAAGSGPCLPGERTSGPEEGSHSRRPTSHASPPSTAPEPGGPPGVRGKPQGDGRSGEGPWTPIRASSGRSQSGRPDEAKRDDRRVRLGADLPSALLLSGGGRGRSAPLSRSVQTCRPGEASC